VQGRKKGGEQNSSPRNAWGCAARTYPGKEILTPEKKTMGREKRGEFRKNKKQGGSKG